MKLLGETQPGAAKPDRKLLKPLLERRRRERMNRSLESLRAMLLQGDHAQGLLSPRVEKARILESTVQFLRQWGNAGGHGGGEYQEGFSACLGRAVHFLQGEGEGSPQQAQRGLSLDTSVALRLSQCVPSPQGSGTRVRRCPPAHAVPTPSASSTPRHRAKLSLADPNVSRGPPSPAKTLPPLPPPPRVAADQQPAAVWRPWP
ncbi:hairy and enhancer of split related-7 [Amia ocellicauda]|uniref:hairy and enhancer of split related-7 n=1 Tax=Amia ocellicauda TaxID=2972642 RepID=UPI003463976F